MLISKFIFYLFLSAVKRFTSPNIEMMQMYLSSLCLCISVSYTNVSQFLMQMCHSSLSKCISVPCANVFRFLMQLYLSFLCNSISVSYYPPTNNEVLFCLFVSWPVSPNMDLNKRQYDFGHPDRWEYAIYFGVGRFLL